jgi:flagellar biosynthetic protein FliR
MHTAGMLIATQSGLATAMLFDASQSTQSSAMGLMLTMMATMTILALDMHHAMLSAFVDSYSLFVPHRVLPFEDIANYFVRAAATSFDIAIRIAAPVVVVAVFINLGGAVLARIMPQLQIFFLLMPAQLMISFFVLLATLSVVMLVFTEYAKDSISRFLIL